MLTEFIITFRELVQINDLAQTNFMQGGINGDRKEVQR